jgi:hypothetical protein
MPNSRGNIKMSDFSFDLTMLLIVPGFQDYDQQNRTHSQHKYFIKTKRATCFDQLKLSSRS